MMNISFMKKTVFLISVILSQFTISQAHSEVQATAVDAQQQNQIAVYTRPEILGLWGMEIPQNKACVEYYNFRSGNEVVVNSSKEWSIGQFDYQPSPDNTKTQMPTLMMQINYENNEKDCSGAQVDQAGELSQYYVKWTTPNIINFCANEQGKDCFASLHRVLP